MDVATRSLEQAKLAYEEAAAGATVEERGVAKANVAKAEAANETLKATAHPATFAASGGSASCRTSATTVAQCTSAAVLPTTTKLRMRRDRCMDKTR